jgi:hypothetical protein
MATTQRERYREMLAALEQARQQVQRSTVLHQVALNRLHEAEVEGFADDATQREASTAEMAAQLDQEREVIIDLRRQAEAQRVLAIAEEIDEVIAASDAALAPLVAMVEAMSASVAAAVALVERAAALAADLPAGASPSQWTVAEATRQAATLARQVADVQATLTRSEWPPPAVPAA